MKIAVFSGFAALIVICGGAWARSEREVPPGQAAAINAEPARWDAWREPLRPGRAAAVATPAVPPAEPVSDEEIDVVDAHWMALTMWGEARSGGEEAMRAVGHVIDNRRRLGSHGRYVTETVSAAWQFSCWNADDPNRAKLLAIDSLSPGSREHETWLDAKWLAAEILAGRSQDPTGGALFYHTPAVAPGWSLGVTPSAFVGGHLFFRTAR